LNFAYVVPKKVPKWKTADFAAFATRNKKIEFLAKMKVVNPDAGASFDTQWLCSVPYGELGLSRRKVAALKP